MITSKQWDLMLNTQRELEKERNLLKIDFRVAKACWNAACDDISKLQNEVKELKEIKIKLEERIRVLELPNRSSYIGGPY